MCVILIFIKQGLNVSHSYSNLLCHCVWSTKDRQKFLSSPIFNNRIYKYIGGIIKNENGSLIEIGGMSDHIHLFFLIKPNVALASLMRVVKSKSSKFIRENQLACQTFAWQPGYGAFSVSVSQFDTVVRYIKNQKEHHKVCSFEEEYLKLLDKHGIVYAKQYVF